ncbi:hypothetical protein [Geminocystis sp. NIES-3709]|nr:hypothetical protein [Geminocystis sp. NIES-3709]BAQ65193.1 hypothetical protein GM3709_1958 [Geminocystis sp. NIES-3709]
MKTFTISPQSGRQGGVKGIFQNNDGSMRSMFSALFTSFWENKSNYFV